MPAKVLLLGLDSASGGLVQRWMTTGDLPNLRRLRERGSWGLLSSPPGLGDDATWASFATCMNPGAHGRFYFRTIEPASYDYRRVRESDRKRESFWDSLSRQGRRTAVIDVPKCPLSQEVNGLQLADWRVHGRDGPTRSFPPELASEVLDRYGDDDTDRPGTKDWLCRLETLEEAKLEGFLARLLESVARKTSLAQELLAREDWDLFLLVFKEAHCAGHQCWHLVDPTHPAYSASLAERLANPLLRVYQALDHAVGELAAQIAPDGHLLVFSDLDMGPNYTGEQLLDDILATLETRLWPSRVKGKLGWRQAAHALERRLVQPLTGRRPKADRIRPGRVVSQLEHNEISGAVRLNLQGREPAGTVAPGADCEAIIAALTRELLQLVNPATGGPAVREVLRSDRLFHGDHTGLLPDLLVVWNRDAPLHVVRSPLLGTIHGRDARYRTGNHLADGFCLAAGTILSGRPDFRGSITDIGPTVAHLLGIRLDGVEGRPIRELCP